MKSMLEKMVSKNQKWTADGHLASYIPELMKACPSHLGVSICDCEGVKFSAGDCNQPFTIQSVAKPLVLLLALSDSDEKSVFDKIGVEPTGMPFNSIDCFANPDFRRKTNPMINVGALTTYSFINGKDDKERFNRILHFVQKLSGNPNLTYDHNVYMSERETGYRNKAIGYLLQTAGIIDENIESFIDIHFKVSSINVTCRDLASIGSILANRGVNPLTGESIVPKRHSQIANAIMTTCGMYNSSGAFAVDVGLPSKSGVGGGILSVAPGKMGIGIYGPALDEDGNSLAGTKLIEDLSRELNLSLY